MMLNRRLRVKLQNKYAFYAVLKNSIPRCREGLFITVLVVDV